MSKSLKKILHNVTADKRDQIMSYVGQVCAEQADILTRDHILFLSRIAEEVFEEAQPQTLFEASRQFSNLSFASHSLIFRFAVSDFQIAAAVLRNSPVLTDDDLVEIIRSRSDQHRLSIANRETLSSLVTDSLITYGNLIHMMAIVQNRGASFSQNGFERLAEEAKNETGLGEALSYRGDMPIDIATSLIKYISTPMGQRLRQSVETSQNIALVPRTKRDLIIAREKSNFSDEAKACIKAVLEGSITANECVIRLCDEDKAAELCQFLAGLAEINEASVSSSLFKLNGTKIAQICKAVDLSQAAFSDIAMLRIQRMRLPMSQADILIDQYKTMTFITARRTVKALQGGLNASAARSELGYARPLVHSGFS